MHGVMTNIAHLCTRERSKTWGKEGWKKVVVCIVSDGRMKINSRTLSECEEGRGPCRGRGETRSASQDMPR